MGGEIIVMIYGVKIHWLVYFLFTFKIVQINCKTSILIFMTKINFYMIIIFLKIIKNIFILIYIYIN